MANHQRTAADVAQLESDNEHYRTENERLVRDLAVMTSDRNRLQVENAMLSGTSRENLIKATRMETIVRQVSAGLVSALQEITQERRVQSEMRRQVQADQLTEETGAPPSFLRRSAPDRDDTTAARAGHEMGRPALQASAPVDRTREVARAAEMIAPPARPASSRIDHTLADKDSRMPGPPLYGEESSDEESLERLAGDMPSTRREG